MNIRDYKLTYEVFNFFKRSQLKHNLPLYKKYGLSKKYFSPVSSEDFRDLESTPNIYDAEDSSLVMPNNSEFKSLDEDVRSSILHWSEKGYAILKSFFSSEEIDRCNEELDMLIRNGKVKYRYKNKIMFAIHHSDILKNMGTNDRLKKVLRVIMGKEVDLFQSINFIEGSQQRTHSDSIHMTTFPYGNLIAAWIAMEDISPGSGALHYYPGSHKLPYIMNRDFDNVGTKFRLGSKSYTDYEDHIKSLIEKNNLEKEVFIAGKGDVLIWHANLLHGGEKVTDPDSTRKSMVFHYYSRDAICYHEVTQRPTLKRSTH